MLRTISPDVNVEYGAIYWENIKEFDPDKIKLFLLENVH